MRMSRVELFGLVVQPILLGGLLFNYIDGPPTWPLPGMITWFFFLSVVSFGWLYLYGGVAYVLSGWIMATFWNDALWGFWWGWSKGVCKASWQTGVYYFFTHLDPTYNGGQWTPVFFGVNLVAVSYAIMFWSLVGRVLFSVGLVLVGNRTFGQRRLGAALLAATVTVGIPFLLQLTSCYNVRFTLLQVAQFTLELCVALPILTTFFHRAMGGIGRAPHITPPALIPLRTFEEHTSSTLE